MGEELHVYDFDGTLFRSPERPEGWTGKFWWFEPASLDEPCVPVKPPADWWVGSTVAQAKRSISNPDVWAVLMTGRSDKRFRWRVPELLKMAGLTFDEVHLAPQEGAAEYFKVSILKSILRKYPFIKKVQFWDDNTKNLKLFQATVEAMGLEVEVHPVQVAAHEPLCTSEGMAVRVAYRWLLRASKAGEG